MTARAALIQSDDRRLAGASEDQIHRAILEYLRLALPPGALVHHSPNGEKRNRVTGAKLKGLGTRAGWPDLEILYDATAYFFEIKKPGGSLNKAQRETRDALLTAGFRWRLVRSISDVRDALEEWELDRDDRRERKQ